MTTDTNCFLSNAEREAVIELRHAMHREPELSNAEWKTQERIRGMLQRFGINGAKVFHKTGLYVDIEGTASGPKRSIAVRGDIDALPIREMREDHSGQLLGINGHIRPQHDIPIAISSLIAGI
ncbi:hypothetical protein LRP30_32520 [Bradyrhizobium sp. C-145]|uniref:hypothetical protein n=1 Tax=Bradyrhizobium sp. C-145 TaxID=574727 RepID=UPI00201B76CE|nr:hypothetical protein [Bradyrhizobium sp. C-145]UQR68260.1 hypothetical protein LRP30_32520 [Bradyrhizobium sp. C-145]